MCLQCLFRKLFSAAKVTLVMSNLKFCKTPKAMSPFPSQESKEISLWKMFCAWCLKFQMNVRSNFNFYPQLYLFILIDLFVSEIDSGSELIKTWKFSGSDPTQNRAGSDKLVHNSERRFLFTNSKLSKLIRNGFVLVSTCQRSGSNSDSLCRLQPHQSQSRVSGPWWWWRLVQMQLFMHHQLLHRTGYLHGKSPLMHLGNRRYK